MGIPVTHAMPGALSLWISYIAVDDIAASREKAKSLGATIIRNVTEIAGSVISRSSKIPRALRSGFGRRRQSTRLLLLARVAHIDFFK